MTSTLSLLLSLLAITTSLAQQIDFSLDPQTPSSSDPVQLTISQEFDSSCYTSGATFVQNSNTFDVEITTLPSGDVCLPAFTPQSVTIDLGALPAGTYQVHVVWIGAPVGGSRSGTLSFDIPPSTAPILEVLTTAPSGLHCQLTGLTAGSARFWVLQSSADLTRWEDLLLFEDGGEAVAAIPPGGQASQFLRARHLTTDDPVLREFLSARNTWRSAAIDHYSFEVNFGASQFFWRGVVTVLNDEVISAVPIETNYPEPPAQRTIDGWFDRLGTFFDPRAYQIDATYNPLYGFMTYTYIDVERWIADEEESWSITNFQPLP